MAVEFGQEKSGGGSFRGSGDLCLTKAAPLFVFSLAGGERQPQEERQRAFPTSGTGLLREAGLRRAVII